MRSDDIVPVPDRFPRLLAAAPEVIDQVQRIRASTSSLRAAMQRPFTQEIAWLLDDVDEPTQRLLLLVQRPVDPRLEQGAGHTLSCTAQVSSATSEWAEELPEFESPDLREFLTSIKEASQALRAVWKHMTFYRVDEVSTTRA
jgi:hypothetical protein